MPDIPQVVATAGETVLETAGNERTQATREELLSRGLALAGVSGLLLLCLAWELWLAPTGSGTLALKALPLLLPLIGLWRYRLYTFRWLSLLIWVYAGEGLVRSTSEHGLSAALATGEVLFAVLVFIACALHVRQRLRAAKTVATAAAAEPAPL